jgi:stress-induced morphogen
VFFRHCFQQHVIVHGIQFNIIIIVIGSESHFSVVVVSQQFDGLSILERHRAVNATLADELADGGGVHALAIKAKTMEQFEKAGGSLALDTPNCMGGDGKHRI